MAGDKRLAPVYKFFGKLPGKGLKEFKAEFDELTDEDREQLAEGITNGSLTY